MHTGNVYGSNVHGDLIHNTFYFSQLDQDNHNPTHGAAHLQQNPGQNDSDSLSPSEKKELLNRLRFSQLDARLASLRKAQIKTCEWVTRRSDYEKWLVSDNLEGNDGFFWIKGNPGTGKSITMKFLYQTTQKQFKRTQEKVVLSFFFNARGNDMEKSTAGLYRSLLFSLLTLQPSLEGVLNHCGRAGYHNIIESGWQLQMLNEVFQEAVLLLQGQGKRLYCYIDALDECPQDDVQHMIFDFEDLVGRTNSQNFRVCFSSRHYPQVAIRTRSVLF